MSMTVSPSLPPPLSIQAVDEMPIQIETLEQLLHHLYEAMEAEGKRGISNLTFAMESERAWREALSKKLEEAQQKLSASVSREGFVSKIAEIIAPLSLIAVGIVSCIKSGEYVRGGIAIATGALLAADAALSNKGKLYLAACLQRISGVDQQTWLEHISITCTLAVAVLSVCLPEEKTVIQLASDISKGVLSSTQAGVHWSTEQQEAFILEIKHSWDASGRTMRSLTGSAEQQQESPHDHLKLLTQLQHSNSATIADFF